MLLKKTLLNLLIIVSTHFAYCQNNSGTANYYHDLALNQLTENNLDIALNNIEKAIELNQNKASSYYIKGIIYEKKKLYYAAIENFKLAINLDPSNPDFYLKTAYSFTKINRIQDACSYLQQACAYGETKACEAVRKLCNNDAKSYEETYTPPNNNYETEPFDINKITPQSNSMEDIVRNLRQSYSKPQEPTYTKGGFFDTMLNERTNFSTDYTDKTLEDSHIKQSDGTWKPKYKTYSPNRDNDTIPGNRIDYDQNENNLLVFIFVIVIIASLIILLLYITKRKGNNKHDNINNLETLPQQKHVLNSLNSQLYFTKIKFTEGLWYKTQYSAISITEETVLINCLPIFSYNGLYYIQNVMQNSTFNITRFIVRYENLEIGTEYTIDIEKKGKKVSVYKKDLVGIIFKV